jgi:hypothetical protein
LFTPSQLARLGPYRQRQAGREAAKAAIRVAIETLVRQSDAVTEPKAFAEVYRKELRRQLERI